MLVTKSKEPHPSKFTKSHSNGFIRFLDKNYKEKLFNINEEQKDILRKMSEKGILPMIPKNSSQDVFGPVQPFLSFDTRSEKMSQKLVDNALDKISTLLSPKFSRPPVKVKDDSRKLLSPMKQKQSIDHFKRQLASTGSLLRLLTQPNRRPMAGQHLRGEALYRSRELHVLHPPAFYSQTMLSSDGLPVKSELQRKIFTIHIKQDQVIKQHRKKLDTKEQNKLKGTRHDESSFAGDVYDGNWPFCT